MIDFFIECEPPKTTGQAGLRILKGKNGKMFVGKMSNSKSVKVKKEFIELLKPFVPQQPLNCPLELFIEWIYPFRKSEPKKNRNHGNMWCITRPDCDNLNKMFADVLTALKFYTDDSIVSRLIFEKKYGNNSGIHVRMTELNQFE